MAQTSALFVLPPEILGLIFLQITELHHRVAFAITCRYLLSVGKAYILRSAREFYAPWAGCRLICIGSETTAGDLPPGMLTAKEEQAVAAWSRRKTLNGSHSADQAGSTPESPWTSDSDDSEADDPMRTGFLGYIYRHYRLVFSQMWTMRRFDGVVVLMQAMKQDDLCRHIQEELLPPQLDDCTLFHAVLGLRQNSPYFYTTISVPLYPSGTRVLCSLSKAEYVREDSLTVAWGPRRGVAWVHVLLSLICWSSVPIPADILPMSEEKAKSLHRGRWAGDRISMGVLEQLPDIKHEALRKDWKDVSQHVDQLLCDIWDTGAMSIAENDENELDAPSRHAEWEICGYEGRD